MEIAYQPEMIEIYGNKLRIRVMGIHLHDSKILLVKHKSLTKSGIFWAPPGGGMQAGETAHQALKREFLEETGLNIEVKNLLFVNEYHKEPLFAIELFFEIEIISGVLKIGNDPEMSSDMQIIDSVEYLNCEKIQANPADFHPAIANLATLKDIYKLTGYALNGAF